MDVFFIFKSVDIYNMYLSTDLLTSFNYLGSNPESSLFFYTMAWWNKEIYMYVFVWSYCLLKH
jgi:hypothetical protein